MKKTQNYTEVPISHMCSHYKWQIEPSTQYLHVHFNESLNSYKHDFSVIFS